MDYVPPPGLPEPVTPPPSSRPSQLDRIELRLQNLDGRLERITDALLALVSSLEDRDEEEERPSKDLDGNIAGGPRDQSRSLG